MDAEQFKVLAEPTQRKNWQHRRGIIHGLGQWQQLCHAHENQLVQCPGKAPMETKVQAVQFSGRQTSGATTSPRQIEQYGFERALLGIMYTVLKKLTQF
jgi:hypothetical protein